MNKYRILVFGSSCQAQILACRLRLSGHNVAVCTDEKNASWINDCGISLIDGESLVTSTAFVPAVSSPSSLTGQSYDFIFVSTSRLQVYSILDTLKDLLAVNPEAAIVFTGSTFMGFADVEKVLGQENMAFCSISAGGYRTDEGIFCLQGGAMEKMFRPCACGEFSGKKTDRLLTLKTVLYRCGFDVSLSFHADWWLKTHAVIQAAAANAIFACNGDNYELSRRKDLIALLCGAVREGFTLLEKYGCSTEPEFSSWKCMPDSLLQAACSLFFNSTCAEYTLARHFVDSSAEVKSLQDEIDAFISYAAIECPCTQGLKDAASFYYDTFFFGKTGV